MTSASFAAKAVKKQIRRALNRFGYDIVRLAVAAGPRSALVEELLKRDISVVLDVGANKGQFAQWLRRSGYRNRIVSFEPVSAPFRQLQANAESDPLWQVENLALGSERHRARINISRNSVSSSILELESKTLEAEPSVEYIDSETIDVEQLDNVLSRLASPVDRVFLKLDVQGYEREVFRGAEQSLSRLEGVVVESSLSSLYKSEWLFPDVLEYFSSRGFYISSIDREFSDRRTGELLQVNALFWRRRLGADSGGSTSD